MITFEEYQFKIKHSVIKNEFPGEGKRIEDLEVGDWFYVIDKSFPYLHCQISKIERNEDDVLILHYDADGQKYSDRAWTELDKIIEDGGCTNFNSYKMWCITTIKEVAEEWHQEICPDEELVTIPIV